MDRYRCNLNPAVVPRVGWGGASRPALPFAIRHEIAIICYVVSSPDGPKPRGGLLDSAIGGELKHRAMMVLARLIPPDLNCGDIPFKRFAVLPPDPHRFDGDKDGVGCES